MKMMRYQATHIGKRLSNQDRYGQAEHSKWACYFVADGLGGHTRGEIAATAVCDSLAVQAKYFAEAIEADPIKGMQKFIETAIKLAQDVVLDTYQEMDTQTTLAVAWLNSEYLITAHIGDSRVYLLSNDAVLWRTPDHTQVQELFEKGEITEDQIAHHPLQNELLNAINMFERPDPDIFVHPALSKEETLVLCTDGFWGTCSMNELVMIAQSNGCTPQKVNRLLNTLVERSGNDCDNITIQIIKMSG